MDRESAQETTWSRRLGAPGTYALALKVREPLTRKVGALGRVRFERGFYVYVGSALRGLGPRLARHLGVRGRILKPRWHIDYLAQRAPVSEVWFHVGPDREECGAAAAVARISGAVGVPGFGASDCGCRTHLFHFIDAPEPEGLLRNWRRLPADDLAAALGGRELCPDLPLPAGMRRARVLRRENRFVAVVELEGVRTRAHVPNSGRLAEFFAPDNQVLLLPAQNPERKTRHTLILARDGNVWADIDSIQANRTFQAWLESGRLPGFEDWRLLQAEHTYEHDRANRFDFLIERRDGRRGLVEVKCATLVKNGTALFPDAPSQRGDKHLKTLTRAVADGYECFFVFMVQRHDANRVWPHVNTDPIFARSLRQAARGGVRVRAFRCRITPERIEYAGRIAVEFPPVIVSPL